jgi:RNA polymerase sigma-70 factor (ECF subfamily)
MNLFAGLGFRIGVGAEHGRVHEIVDRRAGILKGLQIVNHASVYSTTARSPPPPLARLNKRDFGTASSDEQKGKMTADAVLRVPDQSRANSTVLLATIRTAKSGDHRAFEDLMIATQHAVARLSWRYLGDVEEVKEAVQETFLRVFRHLKRYDESRDFHGWLARITINVCRDLDRRRRKRRLFAPLDEMTAERASSERLEDAVVARSEAALVRRAIDDLPERERLAIILHDVDGLSADDVAEILGNKTATVRVQLSKARAKVRAWVESWRRR